MGSRFLVSLLGTFLATLVILIGGGYAITQMTVRQPRDPFRTGSFEFDLAPGWWCELEDSEYVCTPPGQPPHPAIAVIAVKERSRGENLQAYEEHLKQPQKVSDRAGGTVLSEVSYVKRSRLGQVEWVEALQLGSEVPNYDTYYLAATYVRQLTDMMRTLNVYQR
jgi:hypothetical protein